ncbi:major facilitator [Fusarium circinatum]|uniref:Major facilitator n=1 Tax=Fusarium circinatum TaxID=48490 RepID=A0A8H5WGF8_FUSCI|nr:major facilitator [Fusarium circinatum]
MADTSERKSGEVVEEEISRPGSTNEAFRKLWTKRTLGFAIGCILVMFFFINLTVYTGATSHFKAHSLLATGAIVNGLVRIVSYPLLAKLANYFGRPQSFAGAAICMAIGNAMYAGCSNVDTFLAGGIFDVFGDTWWNIIQQIFVADITTLVNRGIIFTLPESLSAIPTLYGGTYLGEHMLLHSSWRWGYGMWAIILPVTAIPTIGIMIWMNRRAKRIGLITEKISFMHGAEPGVVGKIKHVATQLDLIGALLLIGGLAMTLLPMTIAGRNNTDRWSRPSSIVLIIVGVLTFIAFLVWDGRFASNPIIPYRTIRERNVIVACASCIVIAMADSIYRPFLSSFLQAAGHYSPGAATRVDNAQRVAYNIGALVAGLSLKFAKNTKPFIMLGVVLIILACGLPIYLTNISGTHIASEAAFITSKSLLGVGRGFTQVPLQVSLQAVLENEQVGIATAVFLSSLGFGSNLGVTISGAIWNSVLPRKPNSYFGKEEGGKIFGSMVVARAYEVGTADRNAVDECYRETQQTLAIGSVCVSAEDEKRAAQADKELAWAIKQKEAQEDAPIELESGRR